MPPHPGAPRGEDPEVQIDLVPVESARPAQPTLVPVGIVPMSTRTTTEQLEEVESLYDRGLISADEYKRMRARIVDGE
jgi:Short C-terminal domain